MKYLNFPEVHQKLTAQEAYDMNDFIDAYSSKKIKIYLRHSGFIVRNLIDSKSNLIKGYYSNSIKPFRGLVEPLDDLINQDIVAILLGRSTTISHVTIDDETYTLLKYMPTDLEHFDIDFYEQLYTCSDFLIEREQFEKIFKINETDKKRSDRSLDLENKKFLTIIGSILVGLDKSERYGGLTQNNLYDLMANIVDLEKLRLQDKTIKNVFAQANDAVKNHLIQTKK